MNLRIHKFSGQQALLLLLASLLLPTCSPQSEKTTDPPNIVFLLADDLRADAVGYAGNAIIQTPHIDGLAEGGATFTNAFVTTSICSVSRASILSGQYGRRHGLWGFGQGFTDSAFQQTYPMLLRKAGYQVGFVGKYGVGPVKMPAEEFDFWRGFPGQGSYYQQDEKGNPLHLTRKLARESREFIRARDPGQPFCLSVSFKAPHVQDGAPPEPEKLFPFDPAYAEAYETVDWEKPVAAAPEHFDHFPTVFTKGNEARKRWGNRFSTPRRYDASLEGYYRLIHGLDVAVGEILKALEEEGIADNTVIVFSSDNGFYLGEYGFAGKWYGSDPSIRVPLLIYDPRRPALKGRKFEQIALNIDLAPTLLRLAGLEPPEHMQGLDLSTLWLSSDPEWRTDFFYEHLWPAGTPYHIPSTEGVVEADLKYMRYFNGFEADTLLFEELYDRSADPHELENLIHDSEVRDRLKERLVTYADQKK